MKFLVIDTGIGFEHAHRLHQDGNEVYYYINWQKPFPKFEDAIVGMGFGPNKVLTFGNLIEKVDWIVFTDVGYGDFADFLRRKEYQVFGGGAMEKMELDRAWSQKAMRKYGIPYPDTKIVNNINDLRDYLKKSRTGKKVVKISIFRGDLETFIYDGQADTDIQILQIEAKLGPFKDSFQFSVEDFQEGTEIGVDTWMRPDGTFAVPYFVTLESGMNGSTVGRWVEKCPYWHDILVKCGQIASNFDYYGPLSLEGFLDPGGAVKVTDWTIRPPYPGSMIFLDVLKDYGKLISSGAKKVEISASEYCACGNYFSDYGEDRWNVIHLSKFSPPRFRRAVISDHVFYSIPGSDLIATVTAADSKPEGALKKAGKMLGKIEVNGGYYDSDLAKSFPNLSVIQK